MPTLMITGAGRGIGSQLVVQAHQKGWKIIATARTAAAKLQLEEKFPAITVLRFDVTDHAKIDEAANALSEPIDVLINNAGVIGPQKQSTTDMDFAGFAEILAINTMSPLKIAQSFHKNLLAGNNAKLVNISSQMGGMDCTKADRIAYRASKAALNKITQAQATDFREDGICCIAVHPGWVQSDMGGQAADISPSESATGIFELVEGLKISDTGQFYNWDGSLRVW